MTTTCFTTDDLRLIMLDLLDVCLLVDINYALVTLEVTSKGLITARMQHRLVQNAHELILSESTKAFIRYHVLPGGTQSFIFSYEKGCHYGVTAATLRYQADDACCISESRYLLKNGRWA